MNSRGDSLRTRVERSRQWTSKNGGDTKVNKVRVLAVLALLLAACTPSLNLQVALPEIAGPGFSVALEVSPAIGPAPLVAEFRADARESASYA